MAYFHVTVHKGENCNITPTNPASSLRLYCEVEVSGGPLKELYTPQAKKRTEMKAGTKNPVWDQEFSFPIDWEKYQKEDKPKFEFRVSVYNGANLCAVFYHEHWTPIEGPVSQRTIKSCSPVGPGAGFTFLTISYRDSVPMRTIFRGDNVGSGGAGVSEAQKEAMRQKWASMTPEEKEQSDKGVCEHELVAARCPRVRCHPAVASPMLTGTAESRASSPTVRCITFNVCNAQLTWRRPNAPPQNVANA